MQSFRTLAVLAALACPAFSHDLVITKEKHSDAVKIMGQDKPAKDTKEVLWIGKDRMRIDEGDKSTILRADLKKLYILDTKAKTKTTLDLPIDMKKYMPADMAPMMEQMMGQVKATVTPTTETKKVKDWNTTKYTMTMTLPMGGTMTQTMWVTKDIEVDKATWQDLFSSFLSTNPFAASLAEEMKKIDGVPVLVERVQNMMGSEMKATETVTLVESKDAAADFYEVPKDFTEKPFDPMAEMKMGGSRPPAGG